MIRVFVCLSTDMVEGTTLQVHVINTVSRLFAVYLNPPRFGVSQLTVDKTSTKSPVMTNTTIVWFVDIWYFDGKYMRMYMLPTIAVMTLVFYNSQVDQIVNLKLLKVTLVHFSLNETGLHTEGKFI